MLWRGKSKIKGYSMYEAYKKDLEELKELVANARDYL
jgi:hypothetical protein